MRSLPRARFLFVLQYSPVTRPVVSEYRGICKFWVELGQLTRARSNQRFWGRGRGRGRGKMDWLFFFFTSIETKFVHATTIRKIVRGFPRSHRPSILKHLRTACSRSNGNEYRAPFYTTNCSFIPLSPPFGVVIRV